MKIFSTITLLFITLIISCNDDDFENFNYSQSLKHNKTLNNDSIKSTLDKDSTKWTYPTIKSTSDKDSTKWTYPTIKSTSDKDSTKWTYPANN